MTANSTINHRFTARALDEYNFWIRNNPKIARKITNLINSIKQCPTSGIGKPEPLKHEYSGFWSRRITAEHRLVYRFDESTIYIYSCRYHY